MKTLLDEYLPRRFKAGLRPHGCTTVPEAGLAGKRNGEMLELAEKEFEVFATIDAGIRYQQNLSGRRLVVVLLAAKSNRLDDLEPLLPSILRALENVSAGQVIQVSA